MEDLLYKVALTRIEGVGAVIARHLLAHFGTARGIFEARPKELTKISGITERIARDIPNGRALLLAEDELPLLERHQIQPLFCQDEQFPERLRRLDQAPVLLYYRGNAPLNGLRTVGIIGTRKPTPFGLTQVEKLVEELRPYQPLILSGLSFGVDVAAHRAALQGQLSTVGVIGHGLGHIYPSSHRKTAEAMLEQGGLISEYPFYTKPDPRHFPMRNRIVAGLCDALVVVESPRKGGSLITAEFDNIYNRDVFAMPGRLHDRHSEGCNWLIKTHRASLLESAEDIAYHLRWEARATPLQAQLELFTSLSPDEKIIVDLLRQNERLHIDRLSYESGLSAGRLATVLLEIECKGMIRALPGKRYMLVN